MNIRGSKREEEIYIENSFVICILHLILITNTVTAGREDSIPVIPETPAIHLNVILPATSRYSKWAFFKKFPHKNSV